MIDAPVLSQAGLLDSIAALFLRAPDEVKLGVRFYAGTDWGEASGDSQISRLLMEAEQQPISELWEDYNALFIVPVSGRYLPPYESAQRHGRLGKHTQAVAGFYQAAGFDLEQLAVDSYWTRLAIPDHVGFELAFMSALLENSERAGGDEAAVFLSMRDFFWTEHISKWVPDYGHLLACHAQTPLYQALGQLTVAACDSAIS